MRSKLQNITSRFLAILMVVGLCVTNSSCTDPETTDSTKFALFYAGITDIGPSMSLIWTLLLILEVLLLILQ